MATTPPSNTPPTPSPPPSTPSTPAPPAWIPAGTRDWPTYFDRVTGGEPRQTLLDALDAFDHGDQGPTADRPKLAIDLGCGEGRDTAELLRRGWNVLAIDGHPDGLRRLISRDDLVSPEHLTMQMRSFESISELPPADLVNASFSLPFCPPSHFETLWRAILGSIRPGGRFAGQLFGDRDTWATIEDRSHFTLDEAKGLLAMSDILKVERFKEEEREGSDASDNHKHWHVFHVVAQCHGSEGELSL